MAVTVIDSNNKLISSSRYQPGLFVSYAFSPYPGSDRNHSSAVELKPVGYEHSARHDFSRSAWRLERTGRERGEDRQPECACEWVGRVW
jgi:hypothetical protein